MFNMKNLMTRAFMALALSFATSAALAAPTYHVTIDTSTLGVRQGYLDLSMVALDEAAPAFAFLTNFTGNFVSGSVTEGDATGDVGTGVTLGNTSLVNAFSQLANFGGLFSFDVRFDLDDGTAGSTFSVALFNDAFDAYLGAAGSLVDFALMPGEDAVIAINSPVANAVDLPEPGNWLLMASGLMLLALAIQRRQAR